MLTHNLIRSVSYIEENAGKILADAKEERHVYEKPDEESFWKFYVELIPHLKEYAAEQKNEEINKLTDLYISLLKELESCKKSERRFVFFDLFPSSRSLTRYKRSEEYIRIMQDISNNAGNLLYQIKINL